jgi:excisionase family DNA binding protein
MVLGFGTHYVYGGTDSATAVCLPHRINNRTSPAVRKPRNTPSGTNPTKENMELLCTIAETAALLRVSVYTVRRSIAAGIIPAKRIRRTVRVSRAWLDSYVVETQPILLTRRKLNIGATALRTLLRKGLLPLVRIGRLERIPVAAVNDYVKRNSFAFLRSGGRRALNAPRSVSAPFANCGVPVSPSEPRKSRFSSRAGI